MHADHLLAPSQIVAISNGVRAAAKVAGGLVVGTSALGGGPDLTAGTSLDLTGLPGLRDECKLRRIGLVAADSDVMREGLAEESQTPGAWTLRLRCSHGVGAPERCGRIERTSDHVVDRKNLLIMLTTRR